MTVADSSQYPYIMDSQSKENFQCGTQGQTPSAQLEVIFYPIKGAYPILLQIFI